MCMSQKWKVFAEANFFFAAVKGQEAAVLYGKTKAQCGKFVSVSNQRIQ